MWRSPRKLRDEGARIASFTRRLEADAHRYYPELPARPVHARLVGFLRRSTTLLLRFDLHAGSQVRRVVVKAYVKAGLFREQPFPHWPRLAPSPPPEDRPRSEFEALSAIHAHLGTLRDPAVGAVRALDLLLEEGALVLEAGPGQALQRLLIRSHRLPRRHVVAGASKAFRNAGILLRRIQEVPYVAQDRPFRSRRDDLLKSIRDTASFLAGIGEAPEFVLRVADRAEASAMTSLPDALPVGLSHGDFWPGNILVGPSGRVTPIDTFAHWRTPIYEDVGYFLASTKTISRQVFTLGYWLPPTRIAAFEEAFLDGWAGGRVIDGNAWSAFETLALLNRWAVAAHSHAEADGPSRPFKAMKMTVRRRFLMRALRESAARSRESAG